MKYEPEFYQWYFKNKFVGLVTFFLAGLAWFALFKWVGWL